LKKSDASASDFLDSVRLLLSSIFCIDNLYAKTLFLASFKESKHLELPNIIIIYAHITCFG